MLRKKRGQGNWSFMQGAFIFVILLVIGISILRGYTDKSDDASKFSDCENLPGIKNGTCVASVAECNALNGYSYSPDSFGCPTKSEPEKKMCCAIS